MWKTCFEQFLRDADLDPVLLKGNIPIKKIQGKVKSEFYISVLKVGKYKAREKTSNVYGTTKKS